MTIATDTVAFTASPVISLKGRGKAQRETAYMQIAPLSFIENISRVESIANLRVALGASPTEGETATAQVQWVIGRVASRLPAGELPKVMDDSDRIEFARKIVSHYAAPVQDGKKARKLRAGQLGRRTIIQHKVVRAAEEAWSQVKAELGIGKAQTQSVRNAKKATRAPKTAPRGEVATPSHVQLVTPAKAIDADEAHAYIMNMATTLQQYANKNAKIIDTDFGLAVAAFKTAINKAANDRAVRKAEADGIAASKRKAA